MTKQLFHIGQVVICINDDFRWADKKYYPLKLNWPRFGMRYVVRQYVCGGPKPAIVVQEISNPKVPYADGKVRESGFWDGRFVAAPPSLAEKATEKREKQTV